MQHRDRTRRGALTGALAAAVVLAACSAGGNQGARTPSELSTSGTPAASISNGPSTAPSNAATAGATASSALSSDPLHALVLTDVRTGEEITIGALAADKPLLLETMAIWCSNCRAQQSNVVAAHNEADFHSISLDVDPGEKPEDLAAYSEQQGFDWHFAMASAELLGQLRERFGTAVAVPPGMPKILFRTDGSVEMIGLGELYSAQQIADAVGS